MPKFGRRHFLGASLAAVAVAGDVSSQPNPAEHSSPPQDDRSPDVRDLATAIDFRYAPRSGQAALCLPDDHYKSLVGERGELRYGHPGADQQRGTEYFTEIVEFSVAGLEQDRVTGQQLEAPHVPIIHTRIERPESFLELTTFATDDPQEGRVDNVIVEIRPRSQRQIHAVPTLLVKTKREVNIQATSSVARVYLDKETARPFLTADARLSLGEETGTGRELIVERGVATGDKPLRTFFRFPQEGQDINRIKPSLDDGERLLVGARAYWQNWKAFGGEVSWQLPSRYGEFLVACARNIQQAREVRNGKLVFQVGPTVYRGLAIVDGNFLLEAARYLGYDAEAQQGLETTWAHQEPEGRIVGMAGREHWKDTAIPMFTLVRQAELSQDWSYFRQMQPNVLRGVEFLKGVREAGKTEGSANGRYGLLARGFGDGGIGGIRPEFTNTLWALAGLKAVTEAADRLRISGFDSTKQFYGELRASFFAAARQEMRQHASGFEYLPMLMKEDPAWSAPDEWDRPRPQSGQWALSQAIYPGLVFEKEHPIVKGHLSLMQACTQEDLPAETGWLPHEGVWPYNGVFVAHDYLWAGQVDWARLTFNGFLNHASPLYCWREEQALQGSLVAKYVGDMPHNWASAECILYLRHMVALEDGNALRLLPGIGDNELQAEQPYVLDHSPTGFGRISATLEPVDRHLGWSLKFERGTGPAPASVELPASLGSRLRFSEITGAKSSREGDTILVAPEATSWRATWRS